MGELELVFYQEYKTLRDARRIERKLKELKRRDYIEKIIKDGYIKMTP
jgi:predicted GIY-YIG superfamily endonuclease